MTVLLATREIDIDGVVQRRVAMTGRLRKDVPHRGRRTPRLLDRAQIGRHCDLLEQQADQRKQRDPAVAATMLHSSLEP